MYFREIIFGQEPGTREARGKGRWMAIMTIPLLFGIAWHYGVITSIELASKDIVAALWAQIQNVAEFLKSLQQFMSSVLH